MSALSKMSGHTRLYRRGAVYYHRASIPVDIRDTYPKAEETFSLRTRDYQEALRRVRIESVKVDRLFEEHRRQIALASLPVIPELTQEQLECIRDAYYRHCLEQDDELRDIGFVVQHDDEERPYSSPGHITDKTFEEVEIEIADEQDHLKWDLARAIQDPFFRSEAEEVLSWADINLKLAPDSPSWSRLVRTIKEARLSALKSIQERNRGEVILTPMASQNLPEIASTTPLLSKVIKEWVEEKEQTNQWSIKCRNDYMSWIDIFIELCGDKLTANYSKADARRFKTLVMKLPTNRNKHSSTKDKPVVQLPDIAEIEGLKIVSTTTVNKALQRMATLWKWIQNNYDDIPQGIFDGLKLPKAVMASDERDPFSEEQLERLFVSPLFTGCKSQKIRHRQGSTNMSNTAWYWLPIIALFSGARLNELCQLKVSDIKVEGNISYIEITGDGSNQRLKNEHSARKCPIHKMPIGLGFMEYVTFRRRQKQVLLFAEVKLDKSGYHSSQMTKDFSRYFEQIDIKTDRTSFHSFRHNFMDACRRCRVPSDIVGTLQGHSVGGMQDRYGSSNRSDAFGIDQLHKEINKLEYPFLNFSSVMKFNRR